MSFQFAGKTKRNILIALILLLTAVYCGSIEVPSIEGNAAAGRIKGVNRLHSAGTFLACTSVDVRNASDRNNRSDQQLVKSRNANDSLYRFSRKLFQYLEGIIPSTSGESFSKLFLAICISCYAYLLLLTQIKFIHLQDGSK